MRRLKKGIFITGTDTEVGKTFVAGLLVRCFLQQGLRTGYFKPVATGCRLAGGSLVSEDLKCMEAILGAQMEHELHSPVRYLKPLAPLAAARLENRPVNLEKIRASFSLLKNKYAGLVVEGIGGVMVPLKEDYFVLDMMAEFNLPTLVVCRPALGTINHSLLTLQALRSRGILTVGFLTSGRREKGDEAALTSPGLIARFGRVPYLGHIAQYNPREGDLDNFIECKASFLKGLLEKLPGFEMRRGNADKSSNKDKPGQKVFKDD